MARALLIVIALAGVARADDFEDLGNCKEEAFATGDRSPQRTTTIERDAQHRIIRQTTVAGKGSTLVQTRTYDGKGRLATIQLGEDTRIVNEYDGKTGRLAHTVEYTGKGTTAPSRVWTDEYDAAGHLIHVVAREGDKDTIDKVYTYDKAGRIATVSMDHGATTEARTYDDKGRLVRDDVVVSQQKIAFTYRYDDRGRRIEQASPKGRLAYGYDCK